MRRILLVLAGIAAVSAPCNNALEAQSSSATLTVSATVKKNCIITTTSINFGVYHAITTNRTAPLDATGTITVACTKGSEAKIELNDGQNSPGRPRRMSQSSGREYLEYDIYKNASRTDVWGNGVFDRMDIGPAPSRHPRVFTTYGRVPGGQDAVVGSYTDTVVATVLF